MIRISLPDVLSFLLTPLALGGMRVSWCYVLDALPRLRQEDLSVKKPTDPPATDTCPCQSCRQNRLDLQTLRHYEAIYPFTEISPKTQALGAEHLYSVRPTDWARAAAKMSRSSCFVPFRSTLGSRLCTLTPPQRCLDPFAHRSRQSLSTRALYLPIQHVLLSSSRMSYRWTAPDLSVVRCPAFRLSRLISLASVSSASSDHWSPTSATPPDVSVEHLFAFRSIPTSAPSLVVPFRVS